MISHDHGFHRGNLIFAYPPSATGMVHEETLQGAVFQQRSQCHSLSGGAHGARCAASRVFFLVGDPQVTMGFNSPIRRSY